MNHPSKLTQPSLVLPSLPGHNEALWAGLMQVTKTKGLGEWTLIGGQMVLLHALENQVVPTWFSTDIDVMVNARIVAGGIRGFVKILEAHGFELDGVSTEGVAHRYRNPRVSIDVLAPEGLGKRTDLTTTPPNRTVQVPGGTQALQRTELLPVQFNDMKGHIPRPSLLGAIICKAATLNIVAKTDTQKRDAAFLLSLVDNPRTLISQVTRKDRKRLRNLNEVMQPDHPVWSVLGEDAWIKARSTHEILAQPQRKKTVWYPQTDSPLGIRQLTLATDTQREQTRSSSTNQTTNICGRATKSGPCRNPKPPPNGKCAAGHRRK